MNYLDRVAQQIDQYAATVNMHDLPEIFHYWSHNYVRVGLEDVFRAERMCDVYLDAYRAARVPGRHARILSIGCGDGTIEIEIAEDLVRNGDNDFTIVGADLSPILLGLFAEKVAAAGLTDRFVLVECDLNSVSVEPPFDVIMAHHSLHHIVNLENLFSFSRKSLTAGGIFATCDMIGRNGHMRWPETKVFVHAFWPSLSERQRYNLSLRRVEHRFLDHDCSTEGFEGVRSQDILPLLLKNFHPRKCFATGGIIDVFVDRSFGHGFDVKNPHDLALITCIADLNERLLDLGAIKPTMLFAHFMVQPCEERFYKQRNARSCVRAV